MVVMDHLSESVPSLSKAAQETDQIPRLLLHYARHSGVHHNGNLRSGFAMTEARVSLDRVYNMFPLRWQISFRRGLRILGLLLLRGRERFARWTIDYVQSLLRFWFTGGSLLRSHPIVGIHGCRDESWAASLVVALKHVRFTSLDFVFRTRR